jgi:hypothetical protein
LQSFKLLITHHRSSSSSACICIYKRGSIDRSIGRGIYIYISIGPRAGLGLMASTPMGSTLLALQVVALSFALCATGLQDYSVLIPLRQRQGRYLFPTYIQFHFIEDFTAIECRHFIENDRLWVDVNIRNRPQLRLELFDRLRVENVQQRRENFRSNQEIVCTQVYNDFILHIPGEYDYDIDSLGLSAVSQ